MSNAKKTETKMCGMDREIFLATRHLSSLIGQACRWWSYLRDELADLDRAANRMLETYQKDYPKQVAELIETQNKGTVPDAVRLKKELDEAAEYINDYLQEIPCFYKAHNWLIRNGYKDESYQETFYGQEIYEPAEGTGKES